MKHSTFTRAIALLFLAAAPAALSQTPALVSYQGRVQTGTPPADFTGNGQFKFALIAGTANISVAATATATRTGSFITDYTVVNQGAGYIYRAGGDRHRRRRERGHCHGGPHG